MTTLSNYLSYLQEDYEADCRKKHQALKQKKDHLGYSYMVKICIREEIFKKMKPYEDKLQKYIKEIKALRREDRKLDKLYEQIDIERKKEKTK